MTMHYGTSHGLTATVGGGTGGRGPAGCSPSTTSGYVPTVGQTWLGNFPGLPTGQQRGGGIPVALPQPQPQPQAQLPQPQPQPQPLAVPWQGTAQDFRFNKRLAQRDLEALLGKLSNATSFGTPSPTTIHRWEDRRGHGFMGDKPNRKVHFSGFGGNRSFSIHDRSRLIDVGGNQRVLLFTGPNYTGQQIGPLGPGSHRIPNVQSAIVLPATDIDALANEATTMIQRLSTPEFGCLIDPQAFQSGGFQNNPAIRGLDRFFDAVMQVVKGTPLEFEYQSKRNAAMQALLTGVIANMEVCRQAGAGVPTAPTPTAPTAQRPARPQPEPAPSCPSGRMYYGVCVPARVADCGSQPGEYFQARFNRNTGKAVASSIRCCIPGKGCVKHRGQQTVHRQVLASSYSPLGAGGGGGVAPGYGGGFTRFSAPTSSPGFGGSFGGGYQSGIPGGFGGGFSTVRGPGGRGVAVSAPLPGGPPVIAMTAQGIPLVPVVTA